MPTRLFTWRPTFPDAPKSLDARATIAGHPRAFLRIYLSESVPGDHRWYWVASDGDGAIATGYAADRRAVGRAAADAWHGRNGR